MSYYEIKPIYKKSFEECTIYYNYFNGVRHTFRKISIWRYGCVSFYSSKTIEEIKKEIGNHDPLEIKNIPYDAEFQESIDECSYEYDFDGLPDPIKKELEEYLEYNTTNDLEDDTDWDIDDTEYTIYNGFDVKES